MESGPPPISAKTKNLFLALAETTAQTFMVTSCYVCGGTNMGDQWPWEAKELDSPETLLQLMGIQADQGQNLVLKRLP